jgi:hypothetical protein
MLVLLFLLLFTCPAYADLRDESSNEQVSFILQAMERPYFFQTEAKFSRTDVSKKDYTFAVYDVSISSQKAYNDYIVRALINENGKVFFRYLRVYQQGFEFATRIIEDYPLEEFAFTATISLTDRLLILRSRDKFDIKLIFPIGPGALDEGYRANADGLIRSLTPDWKGASLQKRWLEMARSKPEHFKGRPFIRVTTPKGDFSAIGLHILQTKTLDRAFQSRGCIRMKEGDLYELALIVKYSREDIPLNITYEHLDYHPDLLRNDYYYRPKNFGTKAKPEFRLDDHGLVIVERISKTIPKIPNN